MSVTGGRGKWALHYEEIADLVIALEGYGPLTLPPPLPFPLPFPLPSPSPPPPLPLPLPLPPPPFSVTVMCSMFRRCTYSCAQVSYDISTNDTLYSQFHPALHLLI